MPADHCGVRTPTSVRSEGNRSKPPGKTAYQAASTSLRTHSHIGGDIAGGFRFGLVDWTLPCRPFGEAGSGFDRLHVDRLHVDWRLCLAAL